MPIRFLLAMAVGCSVAGCSRQSGSASRPPELRVLCGSSMSEPAGAVVASFRARQGAEVLLDLGGSETLFPRVLAGAPADIFVCHDPFEQQLKEAGHWAGSAVVGVLEPVLVVRAGNPRNIRTLEDLTRPGLKLGIGDPRYSTCGELFVRLLEAKGLREAVMKQVALESRSHAEVANGLIVGPLDVGVVWNFIVRSYSNKLEQVQTHDRYPATRVTVVGLRQSPQPELRDAFLELCRSEEVREVFRDYGYAAGR